jgi:hypothetical protein
MNQLRGRKYEKNARKISDKQLADLKKYMQEFGDLGGIILNTQNNQYVGGNQRSGILKEAEADLIILEEYETPNEVGTIRHGYVVFNDEKFSYREVFWDDEKHRKASLVANQAGGVFDEDLLKKYHSDILSISGFSDDDISEILKAEDEKIEKLSKEESEEAPPIHPIVAKFSEKYDSFIIISTNEIDTNFLKQILKLEAEKSYKSETIGTSHIITARKFAEIWNSKS